MAKTKIHKPEKAHKYDTKPNGKNDTGAPTKYTPEFIKELTQKLVKWIEINDTFWIGDFAFENNIHRNRLYDISKESKEFSGIFDKAKQKEINTLVKNSLMKKFDGNFAKYVIGNIDSDWKDKQETDINIKTFEQMKKQVEGYGFSK
jgi:hypothetical protein